MQALCAKKLYTVDKGMKGWLASSCAWSASLKVECSLRRWSGGMPDSTGKSSLQVGFRHPEMMRNVPFNATSSFFVWVLRHQAGAANSAELHTRPSAEVRRTEAWAPHVEPARRRKRQLRALTLPQRFKCCLKVSWRSSVTPR